ncbi:cyclase family protein [Enemella sp. A6]|uniref:cyclase family protein n=1 Tax=Enemella sp. A6 TaxID=3440152 RepID=UPI003EB78136
MSTLTALAQALTSSSIEVIDLTSPLSHDTPVLMLPPEMGQTERFTLHEISNFDDRGPGWYWNNFTTGEHTGTHFDAPCHWESNKGGLDISQVPVQQMIGPAVVMDFADRVEADPGYIISREDIEGWIAEHGEIEEGSWLLIRTGWGAQTVKGQEAALGLTDEGPVSPGLSVDAAKLVSTLPILGMGVETVGTDAGQAFGFDLPFPCHYEMAAVDKWGITQLQNLDKLPARGAVVVALPLPIVKGSGSPCRVVALVER